MPDRQPPPSLWGDWTPGDEGAVPAAPPPRPPEAPAPEREPARRRGARPLPGPPPTPVPGDADVDPYAEPPPSAFGWVLAIAGLALATTLGLGFLFALVSADSWLLGYVGRDAGFVVETARQAVEVPFGGIRLERGEDPFVYGLVLPAALVALTSAVAARKLPSPDVGPRARRALAFAAALPYLISMTVVATIAATGDVDGVSAGRLVFWSAVLVGGAAALGAAPWPADRWVSARAAGRALFVPMLQAWAVLTVVIAAWALALTLTQDSARIGYDTDERLVQRVLQSDQVTGLDLGAAPALAVLALTPANLGLDGLATGLFAESAAGPPLGASDAAVDRLRPDERERFRRCALGSRQDCDDVRVVDATDTLPRAFGPFLVLVVLLVAIGATMVAGARMAAWSRTGGALAGLHGALVGPAWAAALLFYDAASDSALDGWSTFTSVMLIGTLAGAAGALATAGPGRPPAQSIADQT